MVINTQFKFIFVHIPKAAGTSVMRSLEKLDGNNKSWLAKTKHETLAEFHNNLGQRLSIRDRLSLQQPKKYFTFGFVRNPWVRMSSLYRYLVEKRPRPEIETVSGFKDFLMQAQQGVPWIQGLYSMRSQLDYFSFADRQIKIDFLGHHEHLPEDIELVSRLIGVPIQLGHENRSSNTGADFRKEYDDEMIKIVADRFSEEIALFGYDVQSAHPKKRCSGELRCAR